MNENTNKAEEELILNTSNQEELSKSESFYVNQMNYIRIDENILSKFTQSQIEKNAIHGTLSGYSMITRYNVYQRKEETKDLVCLVEIGDRLCGHPEIVHGGIISAIFDNTFGWLYITNKLKSAFTANLTINFRKPIYANNLGVV